MRQALRHIQVKLLYVQPVMRWAVFSHPHAQCLCVFWANQSACLSLLEMLQWNVSKYPALMNFLPKVIFWGSIWIETSFVILCHVHPCLKGWPCNRLPFICMLILSSPSPVLFCIHMPKPTKSASYNANTFNAKSDLVGGSSSYTWSVWRPHWFGFACNCIVSETCIYGL